MHEHSGTGQWLGSRERSPATSVATNHRSVNEPILNNAGVSFAAKLGSRDF